jgi:UDP-N-acetyl-D-mannosaminuronic acid transferase (WecB/TagA/CpsF family)
MTLPALDVCWIRSVPVHRASRSDVRDRIAAFVADGGRHQIVTVNMDFLRLAGSDDAFRAALNAADLAVGALARTPPR